MLSLSAEPCHTDFSPLDANSFKRSMPPTTIDPSTPNRARQTTRPLGPSPQKRRVAEALDCTSPSRTPELDAILVDLGHLLNVTLFNPPLQSPGKRPRTPRSELKSLTQFLYFKNENALRRELCILRKSLPENRSLELTLQCFNKEKERIKNLALPFDPIGVILPKVKLEEGLDSPASDAKQGNGVASFTTTSATDSFLSTNTVPTSCSSGDADEFHQYGFVSSSDFRNIEIKYPIIQTPRCGISSDSSTSTTSEKNVSPSKYFRIRQISDGLTETRRRLPGSYSALAFALRVEMYRIMRAGNLTAKELQEQLPETPTTKSIRTLSSRVRLSNILQERHTTDLNETTFCARLQWSTSSDAPLLDLEVLPLRSEKSHGIQRTYGASRCLVIDLPTNKPPHDLPREETMQAVVAMLSEPQELLHRTWRLIHAHAKKPQVILFAVTGDDIDPVSISEVLDYFLQIRLNSQQLACKLFARMDLAVSRTTPTVTFDASQIHYDVSDIRATEFNKEGEQVVMSDGCAEISTAAMNQARLVLGLDYIPSVIQARILGAKGIWYRSNEDEHAFEEGSSNGVWIKIAASQIKVRHNIHMASHAGLEKLTLNINSWSRTPRPSLLYPGFLPILVNRGVTARTILEIARRQIQISGDKYLSALESREEMLLWVHQHFDIMSERSNPRKQGSHRSEPWVYRSREERLCSQIEAGFEPLECPRAAAEAIAVGDKAFKREGKRFKINLSKSTTVIGICDPYGCLESDEICLNFLTPFPDTQTGLSVRSLAGKDILVARNPSLRQSDMQKVRAVYKHQLEHLHDVVVFPSKGSQPIADMLSGGDYDGDTFWVCWDKALVDPFVNAPAPESLPPVEQYCITRDTLKMCEVIQVPAAGKPFEEEQINDWIYRCAKRRLECPLLGTVTNYHSSYTYVTQDISSEKATLLVDLHDHLVDADKQGLNFDDEAWKQFKHRHELPGNLKAPAHRVYTQKGDKADRKMDTDSERYNPKDITDALCFEVVKPEIDKIKLAARKKLENVRHQDQHLDLTYYQFKNDKRLFVSNELRLLKDELQSLRHKWTSGMGRYARKDKDPKMWKSTVKACHTRYLDIKPANLDHEIVQDWMRVRGGGLTTWEELKASTLAAIHWNCGFGKMMFGVAGHELCSLKAQSSGSSRVIREDIYLLSKPQKRKVPLISFGDDSDPEQSDCSEVFEGDNMFDGFQEEDFAAVVTPSRKRVRSSDGNISLPGPSEGFGHDTNRPILRPSWICQPPSSAESHSYIIG